MSEAFKRMASDHILPVLFLGSAFSGRYFNGNTVRTDRAGELELLRRVSRKISAVFTTEPGTFVQDELFRGFRVYGVRNQHEIPACTTYGELFRLCEEPGTPEEQAAAFRARLGWKLVQALMRAPMLLLCCSAEEQQTVADRIAAFSAAIPRDHLIVVETAEGMEKVAEEAAVLSAPASGQTVPCTAVKAGDFRELFACIDLLVPASDPCELRDCQTVADELLRQTEKGERRVFVRDMETAAPETLGLYIGSRTSIAEVQKSFDVYGSGDFVRKALEGQSFDYNGMAMRWYDHMGITSTEYTPVFLVRHMMTVPYETCGQKFRANYESRKEHFARLPKAQNYDGNYQTIKAKYERERPSKLEASSIGAYTCKELQFAMVNGQMTPDECLEFLRQILKDYPEIIQCSPFKKTACFAWYLKYEK